MAQATAGQQRRFWNRDVPFSMRVGRQETPWILLFLAPFTIMYIGFTLWPLIATFVYSLHQWNGSTPLTDFVGLDNYLRIAQDPSFHTSFRNTLFFAVANTTIKLPLSLTIALILTRHWFWAKRLFRTVFFAPLVIPVAMAGLIFKFLLSPTNGAVNDVLANLGLTSRPIDFIGNPDYALWTIVIVSVWQIFGQYMIYWMAALANVPEALYEAAEIDGANELQKLLYVTLPVIRPIAVVIVFLSFVNALKVFGLVVTMTGGGPGQHTYVVSYFIYNQAFQARPFRYGYASAAAVLFGFTVLLAVTVQGFFVRKYGRSAY